MANGNHMVDGADAELDRRGRCPCGADNWRTNYLCTENMVPDSEGCHENCTWLDNEIVMQYGVAGRIMVYIGALLGVKSGRTMFKKCEFRKEVLECCRCGFQCEA